MKGSILFISLALTSSAIAFGDDSPAPAPVPESAPTADAPGLSQGSASPLAPGTPAPEPTPEPPAAVEVPKETAAAEPAPAPPAEPEPQHRQSTMTRREHERLSAYKTARPTFAFSMLGSLRALGGQALVSAQGTNPTYGGSLQFEWQPAFIQAAGVLGLGVSAGIYVPYPMGTVTSSALGIFSGGAQARYQARYFRGQPIVPFGGYGAEYIRYSFTSAGAGGLLAHGPFFGGMLLLNWLEPSVAHQGYMDNGLARSYLSGEVRMLQGADSVLTLSGMSIFFGLRMEFI